MPTKFGPGIISLQLAFEKSGNVRNNMAGLVYMAHRLNNHICRRHADCGFQASRSLPCWLLFGVFYGEVPLEE
jgi:hypothetical protein